MNYDMSVGSRERTCLLSEIESGGLFKASREGYVFIKSSTVDPKTNNPFIMFLHDGEIVSDYISDHVVFPIQVKQPPVLGFFFEKPK